MICGAGSSIKMRGIGASAAVLAGLVLAGCPAPAEVSHPPVGAESLLYGVQRCRRGAECATGLCSLGTCQGYLTSTTEISRDAVAGPLREAAAGDPDLAREIVGILSDVLAETDSDAFIRARAADAFQHLPPGWGRAALPKYLADSDDPVRFFAARALHVLGDPSGDPVLRSFLDHRSADVRQLAREALGE